MQSIVLKLLLLLFQTIASNNVPINTTNSTMFESLGMIDKLENNYMFDRNLNRQTRTDPCIAEPCNGGTCEIPTTDTPPTTVPFVDLESICEEATPLEVVFLVDGSGSVGAANFATQIEFLKQTVSAMNIGSDATRVAMMQYSGTIPDSNYWKCYWCSCEWTCVPEAGCCEWILVSNVEFDFLDDKNQVLAAFDAVEYIGAATLTGAAITACHDQIIDGKTRSGSTINMIVLTDGKSSDDVGPPSDAMRDLGVVMIAVGWAGANFDELNLIGNDPDLEHVFVATTSDSLLEITNTLTNLICTSEPFDPLTGTNYQCNCPYLYTGANCETLVLPCEFSETNNGNPCSNSGTCENINSNTDYSCTCADGFTTTSTDKDCETVIPCFSNPCVEGTCTDTLDFADYSCTCTEGYSNKNCQTVIPCFSVPCSNFGTCTDEFNFESYNHPVSFECDCVAGFIGATCDTYFPCELNDGKGPCQNGAKCNNMALPSNPPGIFFPECVCEPGFTGVECELPIPCLTAVCDNSGTCVDSADYLSHTCDCLEFFEGESCEIVTPCQDYPCVFGTCSNTPDGLFYVCECISEYTGDDCETPSQCKDQETTGLPCQNGGSCQDSNDLLEFTCTCAARFTGDACETPAPCNDQLTTNLPCLNGGSCVDSIDLADYTCTCGPDFTGDDCETPAPCNEQTTTNLPCLNGGTCINSVDLATFTCSCLVGEFAGDICETPAPCSQQLVHSVPCLNGGTYDPDLMDYTCSCPVGDFAGKNCEIPAPCTADPCKNGAVCENNADFTDASHFTCTCADGFTLTPTDLICATPIPCFGDNNPCKNSAQCLNSINFDSYTCICSAGTISLTPELICETVVPCSLLPCKNEATCSDFGDMSDYQCTCVGDFSGKNCELPIPCLSGPNAGGNPCFNGGACTNDDDFLGETCECSSTGFSGTHCDNSIPCFSTPCQHGGACTDVPDENGDLSSYTCVCEPGFTGGDCETPAQCADQSTNGLPCQNGGSCQDSDDLATFTCTCATGFTGDDCEIPAQCNDQASLGFPCLNGATCTDSADLASYTCECSAEFTGSDCEIPAQCNDQTTLQTPCKNGGTCTDSVDLASHTCTCAEGFTGDNCEIGAKCNNQETFQVPCRNGGTCTDSVDLSSYTCSCAEGFTGENCQIGAVCNDQETLQVPCQNGGSCTDSLDLTGHTCTCLPGFTDSNCETPIPCFSTESIPHPCLNGGTCVNSPDFLSYICECSSEFTNTNCQDELDSCGSSPCLNFGTCTDLTTGFSCECSTSFTGNTCQTPIPCEVNGVAPCGDGGVCINFEDFSNFICECDGYHEGEFCQNEIIFPPGGDTNPTLIVDPFPCLWTDPFCIIYLHAGIVIQAYDIPDVNFLSEDDFCDEDDLCDQRCEDFNPEWCAETCVECVGIKQQSSRKKRQLAGPPANSALDVLETYGCWCSKMFTGFALMGEVLDDTDALCREFSRCWRCIGMMECEGDLADPYVLEFIPNSDNYTCTSDSKCAEQRCLCTAKASVELARHMIERNSTLVAENYNVDPSLCVRGDGSVFNDQCCGPVPDWIPYNGLTQACVEGITREGEDGWIVIEV